MPSYFLPCKVTPEGAIREWFSDIAPFLLDSINAFGVGIIIMKVYLLGMVVRPDLAIRWGSSVSRLVSINHPNALAFVSQCREGLIAP